MLILLVLLVLSVVVVVVWCYCCLIVVIGIVSIVAVVVRSFPALTKFTRAPPTSSHFHRLHTVAFYDRVLVLNQGSVAEYDTPLALLENPDSEFRAMCEKVRSL